MNRKPKKAEWLGATLHSGKPVKTSEDLRDWWRETFEKGIYNLSPADPKEFTDKEKF